MKGLYSAVKLVLIILPILIFSNCNKEDEPVTEDPIVAEFSAIPTNISIGDSVLFSTSYDNSYTLEWSFEGGNPSISTALNPSVIYESEGSFDVTLSVTKSSQNASKTETDYIMVNGPNYYQDKVFTESVVTYDVVYGIDNSMHKMNLFEPKGDTRTERPIILIFGGGAFNGSNLTQIEPLANELTKYGVVVAVSRYRSGPANPGLEYQTMLMKGMQDSKAAIRFLRANAAQYRIDTDNIFGGGYATGGILAHFHGFMDESDLDANGLAFLNSVGGIEGSQGNPGESSEVAGLFTFSGGMYQDLSMIKSDDVPIFAVHGDADPSIPHDSATNSGSTIYGSTAIVNYASQQGLEASVYLIPGGAHNSPLFHYEDYMDELMTHLRTVLK